MKILNIIKDKWNGFVLDRLHKQIINGTEKYINKKNSLKKWIPGKDWVQYSGPSGTWRFENSTTNSVTGTDNQYITNDGTGGGGSHGHGSIALDVSYVDVSIATTD